MKKIRVKVFDAYAEHSDDEFFDSLNLGWRDKFDFHMHLIDNDGYVWDDDVGFKAPKEYITEEYKYELEPEEKSNLHILDENVKLFAEKLERAEQDYHNYMTDLLSKLDIPDDVFLSEWDCPLSPIGQCLCHWDGSDNTCVFCGEPDERK